MVYVAGLIFSEDAVVLALIKKNRPEWQRDKLNAIGGKVEPNESPADAMVRECKEEAGIYADFQPFLCLHGDGFIVHFFRAFTNDVFKVEAMTDEEIVHVMPGKVSQLEVIPNLRWIVPMALDRDVIFADVEQP